MRLKAPGKIAEARSAFVESNDGNPNNARCIFPMLNSLQSYFAEQFGGKRAALRLLRYQTAGTLGILSGYGNAPLRDVQRLVFVCSGNICRSPFAHHLALSCGFPSVSFGLHSTANIPANPNALEIAREFGVSLSSHRSTLIDAYVPEPGDLVLCFDPQHAETLDSIIAHREGVRVNLLGMWRSPPLAYIHDPYGLGDAHFRICFRRIHESVLKVCERISSQSPEPVE